MKIKDQELPKSKNKFRDFDDFDSEASVALYNVLNAYAHLDLGVGYV